MSRVCPFFLMSRGSVPHPPHKLAMKLPHPKPLNNNVKNYDLQESSPLWTYDQWKLTRFSADIVTHKMTSCHKIALFQLLRPYRDM